MVTNVDPESEAERAGLMPGDVIREINRKPVTSMKEFDRAASSLKKRANRAGLDQPARCIPLSEREDLSSSSEMERVPVSAGFTGNPPGLFWA